MLRNYLTSAFRNLRRHKGYALINIFGLSVGIACFLLVVLYLQHELSFDTYHEKGDRIYRLTSYDGFNEKQWRSGIAGSDPVPEVRSSYTDVEDGVSYQVCGTGRIQLDGEWYTDIRAICTESNLFNIFSFDLLRGDPATVLDVPNTAVITESLALRLFGQEDPIGKVLPFPLDSEEEREEERNVEITGLMADIPPNTHFSGDLLISLESMKTTGICLDCGGQSMYLLLKEEADAADIAARILTFVRDTRGKESIEDIGLQPLSEIHFSELYAERQGDIRYVYLLSAIALVLLLIACANYMNLATARAVRRTREVGVRKVMGAHRAQLVRQFLTETLLLTLLALPVALAILWVALPFFNDLAEAGVQPDWGENGLLYAAMLALLILVGLLAGSYPALFLSGFRPVSALRGRLEGGFSGTWIREGLVVFQFAASIVLIAATLVILRQLDFMQARKMGFDAEQVLVVRVTDQKLRQEPETLKQEFLRNTHITQATAGFSFPGQRGFASIGFIHRPDGSDGRVIRFTNPVIDVDFLETMNIPLLAGRNISTTIPEGEVEALVNEAALDALGWATPEEALGKEISRHRVVGVIPDFHYQSMHQEIAPLLMRQNQYGRVGSLGLRIQTSDFQQTLAELEGIWEGLGTERPFEFSFLTDELNQLYEGEQRAARVFTLFAGLAILIACLGLFGLAAFTAEQRTKEIGIRKVFGATVPGLLVLLSRDFVKLVLVAFVVAVPVAYWAMQRWLEGFAYRVDLGAAVFVLAGVLALVIALLTVSVQAIRAALADPVDSLRYE